MCFSCAPYQCLLRLHLAAAWWSWCGWWSLGVEGASEVRPRLLQLSCSEASSSPVCETATLLSSCCLLLLITVVLSACHLLERPALGLRFSFLRLLSATGHLKKAVWETNWFPFSILAPLLIFPFSVSRVPAKSHSEIWVADDNASFLESSSYETPSFHFSRLPPPYVLSWL